MLCMLTMEYYSGLSDRILIHATTWMNIINITLNKIRQMHKDGYCMILLICSN